MAKKIVKWFLTLFLPIRHIVVIFVELWTGVAQGKFLDKNILKKVLRITHAFSFQFNDAFQQEFFSFE